MGIGPEYDGPVEITSPAPGVYMIRKAEQKRRDWQRKIERITGPLTPDPDADLSAKACAHPDCGRTCTVATGPTGAERPGGLYSDKREDCTTGVSCEDAGRCLFGDFEDGQR